VKTGRLQKNDERLNLVILICWWVTGKVCGKTEKSCYIDSSNNIKHFLHSFLLIHFVSYCYC